VLQHLDAATLLLRALLYVIENSLGSGSALEIEAKVKHFSSKTSSLKSFRQPKKTEKTTKNI